MKNQNQTTFEQVENGIERKRICNVSFIIIIITIFNRTLTHWVAQSITDSTQKNAHSQPPFLYDVLKKKKKKNMSRPKIIIIIITFKTWWWHLKLKIFYDKKGIWTNSNLCIYFMILDEMTLILNHWTNKIIQIC